MCHADDLPLLFRIKQFIPEEPSEEDMALSRTMLDLLTTFAFTG